MKTKIILGIFLLLLLIGTLSAFDVDNLKPVDKYNNFKDGCSTDTTYSDRFFFVEKINLDDSFKHDYFENRPELKFKINPVGDNIYYFEDDTNKLYGYQEIVNIDGDNYMVSINQASKLSPSEKNSFLDDLKNFNKLNNLQPIEV